MTQDPTILSWVQGYSIPFVSLPVQTSIPASRRFSKKEIMGLRKSISNLLSIGAIVNCKHSKGEFLSPYFLVPKKNGDSRFVLNLVALNKYIRTAHFKLESLKNIKDLLFLNVFMCSIDLKDAYYVVPVNKRSRKYLRFIFEGILYEFTCLPFGLSTSPYIFCKLFKPIVHFLRSRCFLSVNYLDDFLLISNTKSECLENLRVTTNLLLSLGFIINQEKSSLVPSQKCKFLGFILDSSKLIIQLPDDKVVKALAHIDLIRKAKQFKIRDFAKLIGYLVSICPAFTYGWLYTKNLERLKCRMLRKSEGNFNARMSLDRDSLNDLNWWASNMSNSGSKIRYSNYKIEIFSDASITGWGAFCGDKKTHGFWDKSLMEKHINFLELLAALLSLKSFAKELSDCSILLRSDNKTVIALINRMGSSKFLHLHNVAKDFWQWCQARDIWVFASYIPSKENSIADSESRITSFETEYSLCIKAFRDITESLGVPQVDLFASYLNNKCPNYISWKPDPGSLTVDAFSLSWSSFYFYAFPPFTIIGKVLNKIICDQAEGIVVVPKWNTQPWYPLFLRLVVSEVLFLSPRSNLLLSPYRNSHPLWKHLTLVVGRLSGKRMRSEM